MAKKAKPVLDIYEQQFIKGREAALESLMSAIKKVGQFKEGDFLIAFHPAYGQSSRTQITNSYGAAKKFTVVHVDKHGIPYMKELSKSGNPVGRIISPIQVDDRANAKMDIEFEVDPDYTDAIIFDDEANYSATDTIKAKSDAFKAITEHNKKIKIRMDQDSDVLKFIRTIKVGDTFYRSVKSSFTILNLSVAHFRLAAINRSMKFGEAVDSKGNTFDLNFYEFFRRALYSSQPRTYNELKDPK